MIIEACITKIYVLGSEAEGLRLQESQEPISTCQGWPASEANWSYQLKDSLILMFELNMVEFLTENNH